jgi:hypothetical protein
MTSSRLILLLCSAVAALAIVNIVQASSHAFSVKAVERGIAAKTQLAPNDRFSVNADGESAIVTYKGVRELPESDEYAIVIHVKKW